MPSDFGSGTPTIDGARGFLWIASEEHLKEFLAESALDVPRRIYPPPTSSLPAQKKSKCMRAVMM
jgi:hypothetical protein